MLDMTRYLRWSRHIWWRWWSKLPRMWWWPVEGKVEQESGVWVNVLLIFIIVIWFHVNVVYSPSRHHWRRLRELWRNRWRLLEWRWRPLEISWRRRALKKERREAEADMMIWCTLMIMRSVNNENKSGKGATTYHPSLVEPDPVQVQEGESLV